MPHKISCSNGYRDVAVEREMLGSSEFVIVSQPVQARVCANIRMNVMQVGGGSCNFSVSLAEAQVHVQHTLARERLAIVSTRSIHLRPIAFVLDS